MDFTTVVAGPAQAGSPSPVSKPGIGFTAGAGSSPAADAAGDDGFASLVALAIDHLDGASSTSSHATDDGGSEVPAVEGDDESPLDAPADAATLSLLIAFATPVAIPASTPLDVPAQAGSDLAAVDGDGAGRMVTAAADATDTRAASRAAATMAAAPAFEDVLASAPSPGATPEASVVASASTPVAGATSETPGGPDAPALAAEPGAAAAPPAMVASRASQRPAAHPLRQALAAMAAAAPADATSSTAASEPAATPAAARIAAPVAPALASDTGRAGAHDGRSAAASRVDAATVTPAAIFGAASDAGAAGDGSSDGAHDGFAAAASTLARAAESRLDLPAAFPSTADTATAVALPSITGFGAGFGAAGDTMLRAIDLPAAARFEQTLSSVDPDVRNLQAMVRTVRLFTSGDGVHEARLTLEPEHLGPVALTVRVEQGSVSAHFRAETPAAQRWIETHQQELRAGLREQGLEVKDVVVTTDPDGRRDRQQHAQPARPSRPRRPQDADAPRFEVLV